jgi:hypothetical protein
MKIMHVHFIFSYKYAHFRQDLNNLHQLHLLQCLYLRICYFAYAEFSQDLNHTRYNQDGCQS